jgi:type II secretory pathway pseudopilin PulG
MMRKKRTLTLLEIVISMLLLGFLLTGLFNVFRQSLKKNVAAKEMKQNVLQLELFQQRLKHLFDKKNSTWLESHPDALGSALFISFEEKTDSEFNMSGPVLGMLYLNVKKQFCFATWSQKGTSRMEILLDKVDSVNFRLFDPKKAEWMESWPQKKEDDPVMVSIKMIKDKKSIPFVFFSGDSAEHIAYSGQ